jgi:putative transport protein
LPNGSPLAGESVAAAEAPAPEDRLFISPIRRGNRIIEAEPGTVIEMGDVLALSGPRQVVVENPDLAEELEDRELL